MKSPTMRRSIPLALLLCSFPVLLQAQDAVTIEQQAPGTRKWYGTGSGEWIFSAPILDANGSDKGAVVRFAPVVNLQWVANYDLSSRFGFFVGASVRNLGFIYDVPDSAGSPVDVRYKFRTYTLGVPVGLKIGRMNRGLVFLGYEAELPFAYKEKRFENGDRKDRFHAWFSDRTEPFFHSAMIGFQTRYGTTVKFKYYLNNFHNKDFTERVDNTTVRPYSGLNANLITLSLSIDLFRGTEFVTKRKEYKA